MSDHGCLVDGLVRALEQDSSTRALRRAIAVLRAQRGLSATRAYAILVRAAAGVPVEPAEPEITPVPTQRQPTRGLLAS